MFEPRSAPLLSTAAFLLRWLWFCVGALTIIAVSLGLGTLGYHVIGGLGWIDALLEASMILMGMGPIHPPTSDAGKLFAVAYALYSGIAFLTIIAVTMAPLVHRFLHRFHLDVEER